MKQIEANADLSVHVFKNTLDNCLSAILYNMDWANRWTVSSFHVVFGHTFDNAVKEIPGP